MQVLQGNDVFILCFIFISITEHIISKSLMNANVYKHQRFIMAIYVTSYIATIAQN